MAVIPFSLWWMTSNPLVQTFMARMAASWLSDKLNTEIRIDGLHLTMRLDLKIKGVSALDQRADTLFSAAYMKVDMKRMRFDSRRQKFDVNDISISRGSFALIKYENDTAFNFQFIADALGASEPAPETDTAKTATDWDLNLTALTLDQFRFRYIDHNRDPIPLGMDYQNLDIEIRNIFLDELKVLNDTFDFHISSLSCVDRSGFEVIGMSGLFHLSPLQLKAENLLLQTPRSNIDLDFNFQYQGWPSYLNFITDVMILGEIRPSELNLKDIGYFAPDLLVMDNPVRIKAEVNGSVDNLRAKNLRFAFGKGTRFQGNVRMYGLPDVRETYLHTSIDEFTLLKADVEKFAIPGARRYISVPPELQVFGEMKINGSFTGFYNDFVSTAEFHTDIGTITTDVSLKQNRDHTTVDYSGNIRARRFDIGKFLNLSDYFGKLDLDAAVSGSGLTGNTVQLGISGVVDSLGFMGRVLKEVKISGDIADKVFNGHLDVQDKLGSLLFDGIIDFRQEIPLLDFSAKVTDADLFRLNMLQRDSLSLLSFGITSNFIGLDLDELEGRILIDSLFYREGRKTWLMKNFAFISLRDTGSYKRMMLSSDALDATVSGSFTYGELPYAISRFVENKMSEWAFMDEPAHPSKRQLIDFSLRTRETEDLTNIFIPGLLIQNDATLSGSFDSGNKYAEVKSLFPFVSYLGMSSDSININLIAGKRSIDLDIGANRLLLKEKQKNDTLELGVEHFRWNSSLKRDSLLFNIGWDDQDELFRNKADIRGYFTYYDSLRSMLHITDSEMIINDSLWSVDTSNRILFGPESYEFRNFAITGGNKRLLVNGTISSLPEDTLLLVFDNWKLSTFDIIYMNYGFDLNGNVDGFVGLNGIYSNPNFFSDLTIANLELNDVLMGDAGILARWNREKESVDVNAEVIYHGNVGSGKVVDVQGSYSPFLKNENLDFAIKLENFRIESLSSFVADYITDLKGIASADFSLNGSDRAPRLTGQLRLMRTGCRVEYLNTSYNFAHAIDFKPGEISFRDMVVFDSKGNQAVANGRITHSNLKNMYFNINLKPSGFTFLNTNKYQNKLFYGSAAGSGEVNFFGPPDDFSIEANVTTEKGTSLFIPLDNTLSVADNDFVVFLQAGEDQEMELQEYNVDLQGLSIDFRIGITNTTELMIYLPGNMGNFSSQGFGDIRIMVDPRGNFNIYGDYSFLRGNFFFTLQNLINRRFEILQGGQIGFNGNPYQADVNLKAVYKLKTTLSGLGANITPEYEGQRVNVNAYLGLSGKLANPDIRFSIDFPNLRDDVKQVIYAILDTNDVALMNQQMISLLVMNNFSYASSSANVSSSSLNIISSQLSNWLSQISKDFDIGINYIPGDEINQDELEVALSTQFFDNRLIVDGNVGVMSRDKTQQQASNIVGDVNIEYKLTPDGRIRLRAFNRANNFNSLDFYSPYTQGVGVFYTREFDRFWEIFKRQKRSEKNSGFGDNENQED
jgi:hypothetical protein